MDENTGCSGLSMDAKNPRTLLAGTWQVEMHPWAMLSGGAGSGVYVSRDGGSTWTKVEAAGLPKSPLGKIDVAVAPSDSNRVYALIQTKDQGSVWRSDDGGATWRVVNWSRELIGRAGYYIHLAVSPANEDEILVSNSSFFQSVDGGQTFRSVNWGGDNHDIWWDPKDPDRFAITHDAGITLTTQHGRSTQRVQLPIGQMYHVTVDNQVPYCVYTNMQDDGTMRGPAIARGRRRRRLQRLAATRGTTGSAAASRASPLPDPTDPNIVWATCYGNKVTRYDHRTKIARSVAPGMITLDSPPQDSKYRCHWTAPLAIDPFDHNTVYYGCKVIFHDQQRRPELARHQPRSVDAGSVPHHRRPAASSATTSGSSRRGRLRDRAVRGAEGAHLGRHQRRQDLVHARRRRRSGTTSRRTSPACRRGASSRRSSRRTSTAGTAYVAVDAHLMDNREPYIFKTTDYGATWKRVNGDLPNAHPLSYVKAVAENPNKQGMLFAGTGHGFFYSTDDGGHWTELAAGLPHAPVSWIVVQKQFHDVAISTYGRGLYVLDDITPLEQATPATTDAAAHLFAPRPAYPLVAAQPRADQLLAEGGRARRRCSCRCSTPTARSSAICGRRRAPG